MKRLCVLIVFAIFPICVVAQQITEYNRKGDEAVKRRDYRDARLFYSEGVANCDAYSIDQLTKIWVSNSEMRASMYNVMNRCLQCLQVEAERSDTTAISKLILYYTEGVGTQKNERLAAVWKKRLDNIKNPIAVRTDKPKQKMDFFAGYAFSPLAPIGITVGGVAKHLGWYARFKTNASFQGFDEEFTGAKPDETTKYLYPVKKKANSLSVTAGLVAKCTPWLYASVGAGYANRNLLYLYSEKNDTGSEEIGQIWYKKQDDSYSGFAAEIDFMVKFKSIYVSAGCNTLSFDYIDLNAGIGVFF